VPETVSKRAHIIYHFAFRRRLLIEGLEVCPFVMNRPFPHCCPWDDEIKLIEEQVLLGFRITIAAGFVYRLSEGRREATKMGRYNSKNLIRYEDAIRLHYDDKGKTAWLTLTNYGFVFGTTTPDVVSVVTVGTRAKPAYHKTISISEHLNANDVVRLQVAILEKTGKQGTAKPLSRQALHTVVEDALTSIHGRVNPYTIEPVVRSPRFSFSAISKSFFKILNEPPGAPEISEQVATYPDLVGFTAYFPKPDLILEEERTEMKGERRTARFDPRQIGPLECNTKVFSPEGSGWIVAKIDEEFEAEKLRKPESKTKELNPKNYHNAIKRVSCFGFRGETRSPDKIKESTDKKSGGMLAGVTRSDDSAFIDEYGEDKIFKSGNRAGERARDAADELDKLLEKLTTAPLEQPLTKQTIDPGYLDFIKTLDIMHLGKYVMHQDFKGYVSTSRSTSIAKAFATFYSNDDEDVTVYCYAVRCRGGFFLESYLPPQVNAANLKERAEYLQDQHLFYSAFEQEVAAPGAIWWENIVGMRVIRCTREGPFFLGPVFLKEDLMWEDNHAFSELFELLSGKSQGDAAAIEKSYPSPPFGHARPILAVEGANSITPYSNSTSPVVRFSPDKLTFGRQALGTGSSLHMKVTNLGPGKLVIDPVSRGGEHRGDFTCVSPKTDVNEGDSHTIIVTFTPSGTGERTDALSFKHNGAGSPQAVTLSGIGIEPDNRATLSSTSLAFKEQGVNRSSLPLKVELINCGNAPLSITEVKVDGDFSETHPAKLELDASAHFNINVTFTPRNPGKRTGTLTIKRKGSDIPHTVSLTGIGAQPVKYLTVEPATTGLDFTQDGFWKIRSLTLTNCGNVTFSGRVTLTGNSVENGADIDFEMEKVFVDEVARTDIADFELGTGDSRIIYIAFKPQWTGERKAKLEIAYDKDVVSYKSHKVTLTGISE
jgi:Abnormal spindle-like microcephaly-assoc'd, ASPM-SPD-2-Hydin